MSREFVLDAGKVTDGRAPCRHWEAHHRSSERATQQRPPGMDIARWVGPDASPGRKEGLVGVKTVGSSRGYRRYLALL